LRRNPARLTLSALLGFVAGFALWWYAADPYHALLTRAAGAALNLSESGQKTRVSYRGGIAALERSDFSQFRLVRVRELTFNFILLSTLFAASDRPLSRKRGIRFLLAVLVLAAVHWFAFLAAFKSTLAVNFGDWSERQYGEASANIWFVLSQGYVVIGAFATVFVLWWLLRDP